MTDTPHTPTRAELMMPIRGALQFVETREPKYRPPENETARPLLPGKWPTYADLRAIENIVIVHDDLVKASELGEALAVSTLSFIEKVCEGGDDWHDAGHKLNEEILRFRRANNAALAKAGGAS